MTTPSLSPFELAQRIDHTLLRPSFNEKDLARHLEEAVQYQFKTVCIPPSWVSYCQKRLHGTGVDPITVVGFPLGYSSSRSKADEASEAIGAGAKEIDMVINLTWLKSNQLKDFENDILSVAKVCGSVPLKVILETGYLSLSEKEGAAKIAESAGAAFIKTSTGFATGVPETGATIEDIRLFRRILKPETRIKASGGIRDHAGALAFLSAGADRLGTSSGVSIMKGQGSHDAY